MKLLKPSYEILTPVNGEEILKSIEQAARTCYKSEEKIGSLVACDNCNGTGSTSAQDSDGSSVIEYCEQCKGSGRLPSHIALVKLLLKRKHEAMLEFGPCITVKFVSNRGFSHEAVRHRLTSLAQESTRYCNYSTDKHDNQIRCIDISGVLELDSATKYKSLEEKSAIVDFFIESWELQEKQYLKGINELGLPAQLAREVLPIGLKTELNVKANIREWRHILKLRVSKAAHPRMREIMIPLLNEFKEKIPVLFDDINF